jgi:hypothetical protein
VDKQKEEGNGEQHQSSKRPICMQEQARTGPSSIAPGEQFMKRRFSTAEILARS